jgi:hypothetical protein
MHICLHVKYPSFLSHFNFHYKFSNNTQISNFTKIHSVGTDLVHKDGQIDMTKLTVTFHSFAKGPIVQQNLISIISKTTRFKFLHR